MAFKYIEKAGTKSKGINFSMPRMHRRRRYRLKSYQLRSDIRQKL